LKRNRTPVDLKRRRSISSDDDESVDELITGFLFLPNTALSLAAMKFLGIE
jgi:hypothetical protein